MAHKEVKGLISVTGVYKNGDTFLQEKKCPFKAEIGKVLGLNVLINISLAVPAATAGSVLAGLGSGADLSLDTVPTLLEQS